MAFHDNDKYCICFLRDLQRKERVTFLGFLRILLGCSFSGNIPSEIGNLSQLTFL
jgi:hypothetical protein